MTLHCKCMEKSCTKEHWADSEAAVNPYGYGIAEWLATYDEPHHLYPGVPEDEDARPACPNDTNRDGDCGRPACPNCGKYGRKVTGVDTSLCDMAMPHDTRYDPPSGCPPLCPTRLKAEGKEDKKWPPTSMETK